MSRGQCSDPSEKSWRSSLGTVLNVEPPCLHVLSSKSEQLWDSEEALGKVEGYKYNKPNLI